MRWIKFYLIAVAVFLFSLYLWKQRNLEKGALEGGEIVIVVAILAVLVVFAIFVYRNNKEISDIAAGNYESLGTLLFRKKKSSRTGQDKGSNNA